MTDYIVSYTHGSSGSFLLSIIQRNVLRKAPYIPIKQGQYNDAHYSGVDISNISTQPAINKPNHSAVDEFAMIRKVSEAHPVFLSTHMYRPEIQLTKWADVRLSVILHKSEDIQEIAINGFYKTDMTKGWVQKMGNRPKPLFFSPINSVFDSVNKKNPLDYSSKDIKIAVSVRESLIISSGFHFIEPENNDKIFYIQYRDLVSNVDAVVDYLEKITGQPIIDEVVADIKGYQTRQAEFITRTKLELDL
jgi:hypothetical protein